MTTKTKLYPSTAMPWQGFNVGGGSETIVGSGHDLRYLGESDTGGTMLLTRSIDFHQFGRSTGTGISPRDTYLTYTSGDPRIWDATQWKSDAAIKADGTTAIARTTPTNPSYDLSTAGGELLSEGIPSVIGVETWKKRAHLARAAGSEYLNYEFGWLPLVNDVRNFARVVKNHDKLMRHFYEGSGKNIRRRYEFPIDITTSDIVRSNLGIRCTTSDQYNNGKKSGTMLTERKGWFSGCYTYYAIPPSVNHGVADKMKTYAKYADHLLGVRLTPEVIWNLTPWSWAIDWFTNTGDILHNISAFSRDSLVMKWGYQMNSTSQRAWAFSTGGLIPGKSFGSTAASFYSIRQRKQRFPASPYFGFGTSGSLSGGQKAILLALGLSKTGF